MARTAEQGHTKKCLASAMISAVQNLRDDEGETDFDFRIAAQDNYFLTLADDYLETRIQSCICPALHPLNPPKCTVCGKRGSLGNRLTHTRPGFAHEACIN